MTSEQRKEVINALHEFVIRVTKESATPAELEALPRVAEILIPLLPD